MRERDQTRLMQRLLGPAGFELTCEECFDQLDVFVEAELSGADSEGRVPGMRAHLCGWPACADEHDSLKALLEVDGL